MTTIETPQEIPPFSSYQKFVIAVLAFLQFTIILDFMIISPLGAIVTVLIYTNLGVTPFYGVVLINVLMFAAIFSRLIPSQALISAIPSPESRGSFMSVSSSLQQIAGGIASVLAGLIVFERADGTLGHFNFLGYILVGLSLTALITMYFVDKAVRVKAN